MPSLICLSCRFEATSPTPAGLMRKLSNHNARAHRMPVLPPAALDGLRQAMESRSSLASRNN